MKLNQNGISMVQVVISAGLAGAVALGLVQLQKNAQTSQNTIMKNYETLQIITAAENTLRSKSSCMASLGGSSSSPGNPLSQPITQIVKRSSLGDRVILEVNKEYTGQGQGGKVRISDISFARDGGSLDFTNTQALTGDRWAVTIDLIITLDKSASNSREGVKGFGGQVVNRRLRDFTFVVDNSGGNLENAPVLDCYSAEDEYVEAACSALGGTINNTTGKCDDLVVNAITAQDNFTLDSCLTINRQNGPGGRPGAFYNAFSSCEKNFLNGSFGADSANGDFNISGRFFAEGGLLAFGNGGGISVTATPYSRAPQLAAASGEMLIKSGASKLRLDSQELIVPQMATVGAPGQMATFKGPVTIERPLEVQQTSIFVQMADFQGRMQVARNATFAQRVDVTGVLNVASNANVTGSIVAGGTVSASDERLKENFNPLIDALGKVLQIETVEFDWIDKSRGDKTQIGVKAQNIAKLYPELVVSNEEGYLFVNYQGLVAPVIKAIQEQQKQIESLEARLQKLESIK